jgi:hypothetical protein
MTDTIRDLLISLSSHMAYMQGQLEARHELDDPEDFYWYRESVLLRQKVTDALADEPAVPEGRGPVAVDLEKEFRSWWKETYGSPYFGAVPLAAVLSWTECVLTRWGRPAPVPAEGEVAEVMGLFRRWAEAYPDSVIVDPYWLTRAADLLERQAAPVPVSVSERLPGPEDCDSHGWCWVLYSAHSTWTLEPPYGQDGMPTGWTHWLPAHALPLPEAK